MIEQHTPSMSMFAFRSFGFFGRRKTKECLIVLGDVGISPRHACIGDGGFGARLGHRW